MKIVKIELSTFRAEVYSDITAICPPSESLHRFKRILKDKGWYIEAGVLYTKISKEVKSTRGSRGGFCNG